MLPCDAMTRVRGGGGGRLTGSHLVWEIDTETGVGVVSLWKEIERAMGARSWT